MKWYVEFLILCVIVVILFYLFGSQKWGDYSIVMAVASGFLIAGALYAEYFAVKQEKKLEHATEIEKAEIQKKINKTKKILWIFLLALVVVVVLRSQYLS